MKGLYILVLYISDNDVCIRVGALGYRRFKAGYYAYVGSGGISLIKRVLRHFRSSKKVKWHIDYITTRYTPRYAILIVDPYVSEEYLALLLSEEFEVIKNFGSTDMRKSKGHLFYLGFNDYKLKEYINSLRLGRKILYFLY